MSLSILSAGMRAFMTPRIMSLISDSVTPVSVPTSGSIMACTDTEEVTDLGRKVLCVELYVEVHIWVLILHLAHAPVAEFDSAVGQQHSSQMGVPPTVIWLRKY